MNANEDVKEPARFQVAYHEELAALLEFIEKHPDSGRFVRTLLKQLNSFDARLEAEFSLKGNGKNAPLFDECFKLLLLEFALDDDRIHSRFEIPIDEARKLMDALVKRHPDLFELRPDNRFGWKIIIKKEATVYGIK